MVLLLVSCASATPTVKKSDLIGKWTEEVAKPIVGLPYKSIEFFEDDKVIIGDEYTGTYKFLENGNLEVSVNGEVHSGPIKISGKTLTISTTDGLSKNYIKK